MFLVWKKANIMRVRMLLIGIAGAILGVVFFISFRTCFVDSMVENYVEHLKQLQNLEIAHANLLYCICKVRILQMLGLFLCYLSKKRRLFMQFCIGVMSCFGVIQIMCLFFVYGVKGFFVFLLLHFPQGLIYLLIFLFLLYKTENVGADYEYQKYVGKGNKVSRFLARLLEALLLVTSCMLGILVECYGNPIVLQQIVKYLI